MEIYIINLHEQTKRREYMTDLMKKMGVERFNFVTPQIVNDDSLSQVKKNQLSLYLTNLELFKSILARNNRPKYIIVFEDDVKPTISHKNIIPKINSLIYQMPSDWDMFYLEYCHETCILNTQITNEIAKGYNPLCTAAILYNVENLSKIMALLETSLDQKIAIDNIYAKYILLEKLTVYLSTPPIFVQDVDKFKTTINPYYIVRSMYGYHSCNTRMIVNTLIFVLVIVIILILIFKI